MMTPENEFDFDSDSTISNDENDAEIEEGEEEPKRKKKRKNNIYNAFIKVHRDSLTHEYKRRGVCNKEMYQDIIQNYKRLSSTKKEIWHGLLKKRSFSLTQEYVKDWFQPGDVDEGNANIYKDKDEVDMVRSNNDKDEVDEDESNANVYKDKANVCEITLA